MPTNPEHPSEPPRPHTPISDWPDPSQEEERRREAFLLSAAPQPGPARRPSYQPLSNSTSLRIKRKQAWLSLFPQKAWTPLTCMFHLYFIYFWE